VTKQIDLVCESVCMCRLLSLTFTITIYYCYSMRKRNLTQCCQVTQCLSSGQINLSEWSDSLPSLSRRRTRYSSTVPFSLFDRRGNKNNVPCASVNMTSVPSSAYCSYGGWTRCYHDATVNWSLSLLEQRQEAHYSHHRILNWTIASLNTGCFISTGKYVRVS